MKAVKFHVLKPWIPWGQLTPTRTAGEAGFNKNGSSCLDIWIRIDGKPCWFAVDRIELMQFLNDERASIILNARSDGNAE